MPAAARLGDPVAHSHALGGFIAGAVVGIIAATAATVVIGAAVAALEVATAGLATPLVIGAAAVAVEFGANVLVGGYVMGLAEEEGEKLGSQHMGATSGTIAAGSANVFINGRPAGRATDAETCHAAVVAQGSKTVVFNRLPASRVGDKTACGATITGGSGNVLIGGPPVSMVPVQSEVPEWVRWAAVVASIAPALGQAARALGPALAEVEATGFARAARTGVKALGRTLEERAGRARAGLGRAGAGAGGAAKGADAPARGIDDLMADAASRPKSTTPVPDGVPISQAKFDEIRALPRGDRPPPEDYLPQDYIDQHLGKFDDGASYLVPTSTLNRFGRDQLGRADGLFTMPKGEVDDLLTRTGGDIGQIERELGIEPGTWDQPGATLSRVDINAPRDLDLRMPSGNEEGANPLWMPGGKLPTEAVLNPVKSGSFNEIVLGKK